MFSFLSTAPPPVAITRPVFLESSAMTSLSSVRKYSSPYFEKMSEISIPAFSIISLSVSAKGRESFFATSRPIVDFPLPGIPVRTMFSFSFASFL